MIINRDANDAEIEYERLETYFLFKLKRIRKLSSKKIIYKVLKAVFSVFKNLTSNNLTVKIFLN